MWEGPQRGRIGTVKKVGKARLTMQWDNGTGKYCEASQAELLAKWQQAKATVQENSGDNPENTHDRIPQDEEDDVDTIRIRLRELAIETVALMKLTGEEDELWREFRATVERYLES